jgi:uncharacterized membrane protein SpoIIM required for sporulation
MKATEFVDSRMPQWRELDRLCDDLETKRRKLPIRKRIEFAALYRSACADLALADSNQLPERTVRYLHRLVGRAHNQLYRSKRFEVSRWFHEMFRVVPRRLFRDGYLRIAFVLFWGGFLAAAFLASKFSPVPGFAETVAGNDMLVEIQDMYSGPSFQEQDYFESGLFDPDGAARMGYYIFNNTSIGIRCFVMGLVFGVGGLFATMFNAIFLGALFGYMTTVPPGPKDNFFEFVTAHGPFELNAIVLSAAAGMRLGFSIISTDGKTRLASLIQAGRESLPIMSAAVVLFFLAAMIEGFLSPSPAPYAVKVFVAGVSTVLLIAYFFVLGTMEDKKQSSLQVSRASSIDPSTTPAVT